MSDGTKRLIALLRSNMEGTQGRVVFMVGYGLCCMAIFTIVRWNEKAAMIVVFGYVLVAQACVSAFFEHPSDDTSKKVIVEMLTVGYICITTMCLIHWIENVGCEVLTGFATFAMTNSKKYFGTTENLPPAPPQPPKAP